MKFGSKLSISTVVGSVFTKKSFDSFKEGITLIKSVERYKKRFGFYPEAVMADQIYRNQDLSNARNAFKQTHAWKTQSKRNLIKQESQKPRLR